MAVLSAAVAVIGALCALDLLLTVGLIRRIRPLLEGFDAGGGAGAWSPDAPAPGVPVGRFETVAVDGSEVRDLDFDSAAGDETLVGFFSTACEPCLKLLPDFVTAARDHPGGADRVLAVVIGRGEAAVPIVSALEPVARVVVEPHGGDVSRAFGADGFPLLFVVDGRRTTVAVGRGIAAVRRAGAVAGRTSG